MKRQNAKTLNPWLKGPKRQNAVPFSRNAECVRVCLAAVAFLVITGCGARPIRLNVDPKVERPDKSVVLFFVDGMDRNRLNDMLAKGRLPNIQRLFVDGGVRVDHAVTSIPAMTYPNTVSLLTGRFPGHHGIVGNQWFDRRYLASTDYIRPTMYKSGNFDFRFPTIYEMMRDLFTINVQCHTHRGATIAQTNTVLTGLAWSVGLFLNIDQLAGGSLEEVGEYVNRVGRWPSLLTFYFPGVDEIGHRNGSDSQAYGDALVNVDLQIKRITDALKQNGLLDRSTLVLVTDHGLPTAHSKKNFDLVDWLRKKRGLRVHRGAYFSPDYPSAFEYFQHVDAVVIDGSFRRLYVHLKGSGGWSRPVSPEDVQRLLTGSGDQVFSPIWDLPCAELVCTSPSPGVARIWSRHGGATIERKIEGPAVIYRFLPAADGPGDPLGWAGDPKLDNFAKAGWHTSREWLAATAASRHPDFVPQIIEFFDSPRAGDLVIFSAPDWVFAGHDRGEHGSCLPEDMLIPMYFAGPGLPKGTSIPHARIVDMVPTLLDLLGEGDRISRYNMDGESLAPQLRSAAPSPSQGAESARAGSPKRGEGR